jgi:hypothetical protein
LRKLLCAAISVATGAALSCGASAADFNRVSALNQGQFLALSRDLGSAIAYRTVSPSISLGVAGFDIGAEISVIQLNRRETYANASSESISSTLVLPKVHVNKGLPGDFDIGGYVAGSTGTKVRVYGAHLGYSIVREGFFAPYIGARLMFSRETGIDQLDLNSVGTELLASKKLLFVTPYAGASVYRTSSTPSGINSLRGESFTKQRAFVGINASLPIGSVTVEADRLDGVNAVSTKIGIRF